MDIDISVIIPCFNREKTLYRCVESVLNSTLKSIEVIIVDDCSTDQSWNIIEFFKKIDERVKTIRLTKNSGVSYARNRGMEIATGKYIHFVDSDDYVDNHMYEKCRRVLIKEQPDMLCLQYKIAFEDGGIYTVETNKIQPDICYDRNFIVKKILPVLVNVCNKSEYFIENYCWLKLFKRKTIEVFQIRFDENRREWEDRLFQVKFLKYAQSFYKLPYCGYFYVLGNSSFSRRINTEVLWYIVMANEDYKKLVGDFVDFNCQYVYDYYCRAMNTTVLKMLGCTAENKKSDLSSVWSNLLENERLQELYFKMIPANRFEQELKKAVASKDTQKIYYLYLIEYYKKMVTEKGIIILKKSKRVIEKLTSK